MPRGRAQVVVVLLGDVGRPEHGDVDAEVGPRRVLEGVPVGHRVGLLRELDVALACVGLASSTRLRRARRRPLGRRRFRRASSTRRERSIRPHIDVDGTERALPVLTRGPDVPARRSTSARARAVETRGRPEERGPVREEGAAVLEVVVPRVDDAVEHGLAQEEVAHPLAHDDVDVALVQLERLGRGPADLDDVLEAVGRHERLGVVGHLRELAGDDAFRAGLRRPHGEDAGPGADVEDDLAREALRVAEDGVAVGAHARAVAEHLLLVVDEGVGAEVVGVVAGLGRLAALHDLLDVVFFDVRGHGAGASARRRVERGDRRDDAEDAGGTDRGARAADELGRR